MRSLLGLAALLILPLCATPAAAHLMPAERGTINVVDNTTYSVVSVPVRALSFADDNEDGRIDARELARHSVALGAAFTAGYSLSDAGKAGAVVLVYPLLPSEAGMDADQASYLVFMHQQRFAGPPTRLKLTTSLFSAGDAITLTATRNDQVSLIALSAARPYAMVFPRWHETTADFVRLGVMHILGGIDHLLFILTIVVAATGLRYWLSVLTTFTLAHTITLSLTSFGLISINPAIVEPFIAASIVVMAAHAVLSRRRRLRVTVALVFACGLVHGMGFGSEILKLQLTGAHRLITLAAFNFGIELGQIAFVSVVLAAAWMATKYISPRIADVWPRPVTIIAGFAGCIFLAQRVVELTTNLPR